MTSIPTQHECARCKRLFCYFRKTKPRMYCGPCVELERRDSVVALRSDRPRGFWRQLVMRAA